MNLKRVALTSVCIAVLLMPALASAGTRPPEDTQYAKTGTSNFATTQAEKDRNSVAKRVDLAIGAYECGNNVPVMIDGLKINRKGKYSFSGKVKNLAGEKVDLKVRGVFKTANKLVQRTTVYKGRCEETTKVVMKRQ